jgi:hypothetical protein
MKTIKRKRIRWCIGSRERTLTVLNQIDEKERPFCHFPDGHQQAIRVTINRDTGDVINGSDGKPQIVAPWLLSDLFSV